MEKLTNELKDLGKQLFDIRLSKRKGRREVYENTGVNWTNIKNIEEGGNVSVRVLIKLLRYYDKKIVIGASGTMVKNADFGELKSYLG